MNEVDLASSVLFITPWVDPLFREDTPHHNSTPHQETLLLGATSLMGSNLGQGELNLAGPLMYTGTRPEIGPSEISTPVLPSRSTGTGRGTQSLSDSLEAGDRSTNQPKSPVRSLFVSDVHLGCKHAQANEFYDLLQRFEPENLYIVGDFIDGWKLKGKWRWLPVYDKIIQRLMEMRSAGTRLFYTPGNHDSFLRNYVANFGVIDVQDRFIHQAADGRRYVVTHGDQFDQVEQNAQWLSLIASYAYDVLLTSNWLVNKLRGKKHDPYAFCGIIKRQVKLLVKHVSEFEAQLAEDAISSNCDGIICGHIHAPRIEQVGEVHYMNTGDWVENCSALIEFEDGSFDLIRRDGALIDRLEAKPPELQDSAELASEPTVAAAI